MESLKVLRSEHKGYELINVSLLIYRELVVSLELLDFLELRDTE